MIGWLVGWLVDWLVGWLVVAGYEEDTVQIFQERLEEFLAEDFTRFRVEVDKGPVISSLFLFISFYKEKLLLFCIYSLPVLDLGFNLFRLLFCQL